MAKKDDSPKNIKCSFCGKTQEHVDRIVAGPGVYICDECIEVCKNIIDNDSYNEEEFGYSINEEAKLLSPREIKDILFKKKKVEFIELFTIKSRDYIIVTFLSLLEMAKSNEISLIQNSNFDKLYIIGGTNESSN